MIPTRSGTTPRDTLLSLEEAARSIGRSPRTIRRWVASGRLKPYTRSRGGVTLFVELHVLLAERDARHSNPTSTCVDKRVFDVHPESDPA